MITVKKYICEKCNTVFDNKQECEKHEAVCSPCLNCKHRYYAYGYLESCEKCHAGLCSMDRKNTELYRKCYEPEK